MRVLVLAPYPLDRAPSQRFRWEQYVEPLGVKGISLEPSSFLDTSGMDIAYKAGHWPEKAAATLRGGLHRLRDVCVARRYDLALVHREALPIGLASVERMLKVLGVPYAFDFDDAIYLGSISDANRRLAFLRGAQKTATIARGASLVLAGNDHLAAWAESRGAHAMVVPTTIDTDTYQPLAANDRSPLCVGWSGSWSTIAHLRLLEPTLRDLQRERGIRIRVIGDGSYSIDGAEVDALDWEAASEVQDLSSIDIGLMPLPDDDWARGKCGLKALQYMALGIPTVLSPVGVNEKIARGGAAVLASTPEDWAMALRQLIDDPDLRRRIGRAGRGRVEEEYSVQAMLPVWESALRTAAVLHSG